MSTVCLDTQIIQWGLLKHASSPESQHLITHASLFLQWLEKNKTKVIVPSIIVGELLVPIPRQTHIDVLSKIGEKWMVVDFDLRAARIFAELRYDQAILDIMQEIRAGNPYATRKQLIADVLIIATAIAHGAEKLYSHNSDFLKLAAPRIPAENFLDVKLQMDLPEEGC